SVAMTIATRTIILRALMLVVLRVPSRAVLAPDFRLTGHATARTVPTTFDDPARALSLTHGRTTCPLTRHCPRRPPCSSRPVAAKGSRRRRGGWRADHGDRPGDGVGMASGISHRPPELCDTVRRLCGGPYAFSGD